MMFMLLLFSGILGAGRVARRGQKTAVHSAWYAACRMYASKCDMI